MPSSPPACGHSQQGLSWSASALPAEADEGSHLAKHQLDGDESKRILTKVGLGGVGEGAVQIHRSSGILFPQDGSQLLVQGDITPRGWIRSQDLLERLPHRRTRLTELTACRNQPKPSGHLGRGSDAGSEMERG